MSRTPANDNNPAERPASFDAQLLAYRPAIRKLANKYYPESPEDMAQDALLHLLESWRTYRPDGGFYGWIKGRVRYLAQQKREFNGRRTTINCKITDGMTHAIGIAPTQEHTAAVSQALAAVQHSREGSIIMRRIVGEGLSQIAARIGVTKERVRQLEARGFAQLQAAA
jgi:RNA polymerase sigma factor (sigma-70 family)